MQPKQQNKRLPPLAKSENVLIISDLQIPFENHKALEFCKLLAKEFKIKPENVFNVGDEVDAYFGGMWARDPSVDFTAAKEIKYTKDRVKQWADAFPKMKIAISNHGLRWVRKATAADIPKELLRPYSEIIGAPSGWIWKDEWLIKKQNGTVRMIHGMGYSGARGHINAAMDSRISTVIGHLHSHAGIHYIEGQGSYERIFGFNVGCLINPDAFAFQYGRYSRFKPVLGCGVLLDAGRTPLFVPLD